jgi:hypothetical protein
MIKKGILFILPLLLLIVPLSTYCTSNNAPVIGGFEAPRTVHPNKYFLLNATINSAKGVFHFMNATVELSNGIILKWSNSTNTFNVDRDPNNYCTLDVKGSFKTKLNNTAYKLSWKIKLSWNCPPGPVSVVADNTRVFDSEGKSSTGSQSNLFYFEPKIIVYLARPGIITDGLVLFLSMDENSGTRAVDVSGFHNDGILKPNASQGPRWVSSVVDSGLEFDGQDDYLEVPSSSSLNFGAGQSFTVEFWLKANRTDQWAAIIHKIIYDLALEKRIGWSIGWRFNCIELNHMADGVNYLSEKVLIRDIGTDWHFYAFVFDRDSYLTVYMDGAMKARLDISNVSGNLSNTQNLEMAHNPWGYGNDYFNGVIDEVRIYNRALSKEEVESNYFANKRTYYASSTISFKGWLYYNGTTEPVEDSSGITAKVNLGATEKGESTTIHPGGLFNVTVTAEAYAGNYSYVVYASTPTGNTVQNKTVSITIMEIYKAEIVSLIKEDNLISCEVHGLYSFNKSVTWIAIMQLYDGSQTLIYSDSMIFPLKGGDNVYLSFGLPTLTNGEYTAKLQIINSATGFSLPIKNLIFNVTSTPSTLNSSQWIVILVMVAAIIAVLALGVWTWFNICE